MVCVEMPFWKTQLKDSRHASWKQEVQHTIPNRNWKTNPLPKNVFPNKMSSNMFYKVFLFKTLPRPKTITRRWSSTQYYQGHLQTKMFFETTVFEFVSEQMISVEKLTIFSSSADSHILFTQLVPMFFQWLWSLIS